MVAKQAISICRKRKKQATSTDQQGKEDRLFDILPAVLFGVRLGWQEDLLKATKQCESASNPSGIKSITYYITPKSTERTQHQSSTSPSRHKDSPSNSTLGHLYRRRDIRPPKHLHQAQPRQDTDGARRSRGSLQDRSRDESAEQEGEDT